MKVVVNLINTDDWSNYGKNLIYSLKNTAIFVAGLFYVMFVIYYYYVNKFDLHKFLDEGKNLFLIFILALFILKYDFEVPLVSLF